MYRTYELNIQCKYWMFNLHIECIELYVNLEYELNIQFT